MRRRVGRLLLAGMLVASPAFPADPPAESTAKALFAEGNQKLGAGDYVGALESYRAAYARLPSPKILVNIGTTQKALGRFADAAATYEKFLADPAADPAKKLEVEAALKDVLANVATVVIDAEVPGARVTVDGHDVGGSPGTLHARVDRGAHVIVADDGSGAPVTTQIEVSAGEERKLRLKRAPATEQPVATGTPPVSNAPPAAPETGGARTIGWVLVGVGVAGAAVGTYFMIDRAGAIGRQSSSPCSQGAQAAGCAAQADTYNRDGDVVNRDGTVSAIAFATGAASAIGGAVLLLTSAPKTTSAWRAVPMLSPRTAGITGQVTW